MLEQIAKEALASLLKSHTVFIEKKKSKIPSGFTTYIRSKKTVCTLPKAVSTSLLIPKILAGKEKQKESLERKDSRAEVYTNDARRKQKADG